MQLACATGEPQVMASVSPIAWRVASSQLAERAIRALVNTQADGRWQHDEAAEPGASTE